VRKTHLMVLAIIAVTVVLAVGAVSAYADITTDSQAPVTTTNAVTGYWNTVAITATATDNEGIAYVYSRVDGGPVRLTTIAGKPASADVAIPAAADQPLAAGSHKIKYWAQDINGNVETQHEISVTVAIDTAKPVTAATGATDGAWYKAGVTVHLAASDGAGESGVKELSYALDGAVPTLVAATADVPVPATAGAHTIVYHASDVAGNAEAEKTFTVTVDTAKPVTSASAVSVVQNRRATLKYRVADAAPNAGKATVVIKIKTRSGRVVGTIKAGSKAVNTALSATFTCKLAKGTYTYYVYATDVAGNAQSKAGSAKLTVK
jgi:cytochrome c